MKRRNFPIASLTTGVATTLHAQVNKPKRILLRSSCQTVNIGGIALSDGGMIESRHADVTGHRQSCFLQHANDQRVA